RVPEGLRGTRDGTRARGRFAWRAAHRARPQHDERLVEVRSPLRGGDHDGDRGGLAGPGRHDPPGQLLNRGIVEDDGDALPELRPQLRDPLAVEDAALERGGAGLERDLNPARFGLGTLRSPAGRRVSEIVGRRRLRETRRETEGERQAWSEEG